MRPALVQSLLLVSAALAGAERPARAQVPSPPPTNPLEQLMVSQPAVDVSSPVQAEASFDPPVVRPGEKSVYRVTFNAVQGSIRWPDKVPAPAQLQLHSSASGEVLLPIAGKMRPLTSFNYHARPAEPGVFTVPSFTVEVYGKPVAIPEARLEVRSVSSGMHEPARQIFLEPAATNVYVGEAVSVRVLLPATGSNILQTLAQVQLNGGGFLAEKGTARQSVETMEWSGRKLATYVYQTRMTPIAAGHLKVSAQGFAGGREFSGRLVIHGPATLPGGIPRYVLLDSDPVTINVRPLPVDGKLPGFTGAVGNFTCDPPQLSARAVPVGDPIQLAVVIRGEGDLDRLVPPPPPRSEDWQVFPATPAGVIRSVGRNEEAARFLYTLIPMTTRARTTPAIPFSYFDPKQGAYVDMTVPTVAVQVLANEMATNPEPLMGTSGGEVEPEKRPSLSSLAQSPGWTARSLIPLQLRAWFPYVQLLPAFAFSGLWYWDRRRRHLEAHPEILRRRKARRELRREKRRLRRAAAGGDAAGFTQGAVAGMRIVCAPHFSAEPRALVCADVLNLLTTEERAGKPGDVARRFFAAADAADFAASAPGNADLLTLQAELEDVLVRLEERL